MGSGLKADNFSDPVKSLADRGVIQARKISYNGNY